MIVHQRTVDDGLPVNGVVDIAQDQKGYLWLTTYDGIVRFDGNRFTVFNSTTMPDMLTNRYLDIFRDDEDDGTMWFTAEHGGLLRYRDKAFTFFRKESGLPETQMLRPFRWNGKLVAPNRNGIYVFEEATETFSMLRFEDDGLIYGSIDHVKPHVDGHVYIHADVQLYSLSASLTLSPIQFEDNMDSVRWFESNGRGLFITGFDGFYRLDSDGLAVQVPLKSRNDAQVNGMVISDHHAFVSTTRGISIINLNNYEEESFLPFYTESDGGIRELIYSDGLNRHIFRDIMGELLMIYKDTVSYIRPNVPVTPLYVSSALSDDTGNLWLASARNGLIMLKPAAVQTLDRSHGLATNSIIGVFEDSSRNLWVDTRGGELFRFDINHEITEISVEGRNEDRFEFYAFAEMADGSIYAAINKLGIGRLNDQNKFQLLNLSGINPGTELRSMLAGPDNELWIGSWGALHKMVEGELIPFPHQQAFENLLIQYLVYDDAGGLWVATAQSGVFCLKDDELRHYTTAQGLGNNSVRGIYPDRYEPGTVWFATEGGGLSRYRDGEIKTMDVTQGLHRNLLHNITEDFHGRLWMSTNSGIFYLYKDQANAVLDGDLRWLFSHLFTENKGMLNAEGNGGFQNSFLFREDGMLLYATQGGVAILDTNTIETQVHPVRTIIEQITAFDGNKTKTTEFPENIVLEPGKNDFSIRFTGITFSNADQLRFRYMLEGYDKGWIDAVQERIATYTNLPPRTYVFRVTTDDQIDQPEASYTSVTITIAPAFYQTWWFFGLCLLLFAGLIYGGHRYRIRYYLRLEMNLSKKVEQRTIELQAEKEAALTRQNLIEQQAAELQKLNAVKDKFFSVIAHDLRGPFSGMAGLIDMLKDDFDKMQDIQQKEIIGLLSGASQNFGKLLENLLTWARMQIKHSKPELTKQDLTEIITESTRVLELMMNRKNIKLLLRNEQTPLWVIADPNMLDAVIRNLAGNAVKFSYKNSVVRITTSKTDGYAIIQVQDYGTGISEKQLQKLFNLETTFSYKGTSNESGTGLGLILCKEMLEAMGGSIALTSKEGEGTTFTCKIPLAD